LNISSWRWSDDLEMSPICSSMETFRCFGLSKNVPIVYIQDSIQSYEISSYIKLSIRFNIQYSLLIIEYWIFQNDADRATQKCDRLGRWTGSGVSGLSKNIRIVYIQYSIQCYDAEILSQIKSSIILDIQSSVSIIKYFRIAPIGRPRKAPELLVDGKVPMFRVSQKIFLLFLFNMRWNSIQY
jgi:hypothetical protein